MVPTRPTEPLDNRVALETPEHVVLPVSLAGPGARGLAWLGDTILRSFIAFFVVMFALALGAGSDSLSGLSEGAIFLLVFLLDWAWFVAWELLDGGRSPGKRMLGLRVIRADGTPIGPREAMLRNLVRVADALPGLYLVGAVSVLVDRRFRRLGDLVAGTLVVREVRVESPPPGVAITPPLLATEQLLLPRHRRVTPRDRRALEEWLATSERFGLVWSEWVAARVVDDFAKRYRITGERAVRTLQRLVGAARAAQPELERAAGVGQDQAARLRQVLNNVAGRRVTAHDAPDVVWRLRAVVAELGRLRDVAPSRARAAEELAWEAESLLHRAGLAGRVGGVGAVYTFLFTEFPAALRRNRGWFLVASACFFGPFVGVGFGAWFDEEFARRLVSPGMRASLDEWYRNPESRTAG